jgi:predicted anti-sigma-YlaC factor YlaD
VGIRAGVGLLEASCRATAEALSDRLEGELRRLRRVRVSRHLARCAHCRATLASLAPLVRTPRTLGRAEPRTGHSVAGQVVARIREGSAVNGRD